MEKRTKGIFANLVTDMFCTSKERNGAWELDDLGTRVILPPTLTCHSLVRQSLDNIMTQLLSLALLLGIFWFLLSHDICTLNLNAFTTSAHSVSLSATAISVTWLLCLFQHQLSSPIGTLSLYCALKFSNRENQSSFCLGRVLMPDFSWALISQ